MQAQRADARDDALLGGLRLAAFALVLLVCLAPLAASLWVLFQGDDHIDFFRARQARLLVATLFMSLGAAGIATLLGGGLAIALGYYRPRAARLLLALAALPLFLPPYLIAMAWVEVFGMQAWLLPGPQSAASATTATTALFNLRGHGASALVLGLCFAPIVMLAVLAALRRYDHTQDEAARLSAGEGTVLRRVLLPQLRSALALGAAVVFVLALLNLSVPSLLQAPVYAVEVYTWFNMQSSPHMAVLQSLPMALAALPILLLGAAWLGRIAAESNAQPRRNVPLARAHRARRIATFVACLSLLPLVVLPIATLLWRAWPPTTLLHAWRIAHEELAVSTLLAGGTAALCTALAVLLVAVPFRGALLLGALPLAVAGPVFGVGFITFWNHAGIRGAVYDAPIALLLVCVGKYLGWAMLGVWLARLNTHSDLHDAARNLGAGRTRTLLRVTLPAMLPTLLGTAVLVFVLVLGEVDAVLLTAPPGITPLSTRIYALMHYGSNAETAALGLLIMALVLPCVLAAVWLLTRQRAND